MPDSISSCGVLNAPPARMTSRRADAIRVSAGRRAGAGMRGVQPLAFLILDADRAVAIVEQHARGERVQLDPQPVGILSRHREQPLARADALVVVGRQRRVARADLVAFDDAPVVRIEQRLEPRQRRRAELLQRVGRPTRAMTLRICPSAIASSAAAFSVGSQPDQPWRLGSMPDRLPEPLERAMTAVLDALEVLPHLPAIAMTDRR